MAEPTYFTVEADYQAVSIDTTTDVDADPNITPISATVTFRPLIADGDAILATTAEPRPTGFVAAPIVASIGTDGRLKLRSTPDGTKVTAANYAALPGTGDAGSYYVTLDDDKHWRWNGSGYTEILPYQPVRLLADTDLLELDGPLFYSVEFSNVIYNGRVGRLTGFNFQAPTSDTTVNLIEVGRAAGETGQGIAKAVVSVGTTTTGAPGSAASVTNSGSAVAAVLDFTIPQGERGEAGQQGIPGSAVLNGVDVTTLAPGTSNAAGGRLVGAPLNTDANQHTFAYIPGLHNSLAYNLERGGTVSITKNGAPFTGPDPVANLFNGISVDKTFEAWGVASALNDVYVITVGVNSQIGRSFVGWVGIQMYHVWSALNVKIETFRGGAWSTVYDVTGTFSSVLSSLHMVRVPSVVDDVTQIRYTLTNFPAGLLRIAELFYVQPFAAPAKFFPRGGGNLYGTTATPPALTAAGADANIDLRLNSKGSGTVKANGADVVTTTGAQALTNKTLTAPTINGVSLGANPVGVKVAVPASATAAGTPGQWAADANYHYVCTATNTWRRAALSSW